MRFCIERKKNLDCSKIQESDSRIKRRRFVCVNGLGTSPRLKPDEDLNILENMRKTNYTTENIVVFNMIVIIDINGKYLVGKLPAGCVI